MSFTTQERAGPVCGSVPCIDAVAVTDRELAVLGLMAEGLIATAIARRLGISPRTVGKHIENIYRKLGAHDRTTLSCAARLWDSSRQLPVNEPS